MATALPAEVQAVKGALNRNSLNAGVGILHEPTGRIFLRPFDDVPGGHVELVTVVGLPLNECKGFAILKEPGGSFVPVNNSHINGLQGASGSLMMPQATFAEIVQALQAAGL